MTRRRDACATLSARRRLAALRKCPGWTEFVAAIELPPPVPYDPAVSILTRQQQQVLALVFLLLVTGWATKAWRLGRHLPEVADGRGPSVHAEGHVPGTP